MMEYVIVGNGTAAVRCIEGIRSRDTDGRITVISKENRAAYCRPLISYYLEDRTTVEKMAYRSADFYEKNGCRVLYDTSVTSLDPVGKRVRTDRGETVTYDRLCLATGSSPFVPPMKNLETVEKQFSFLTLDDAVRLKQAVTADSRVLIVGAGLIGLKCAEGLRAITEHITVCDLADHILSSILDADDALIVQKHLESRGIRFFLHNSVACFEEGHALMQNGEAIPFDILVTAVGVRANTGIFKDAGGACTRGITVNEKMETSISDIYAAGDCTECVDITDGKTKVLALMPNANLQGFTAGVNMAGGEQIFDNAIPMNSIGFFGLHLMTAGARGGEVLEESSGGTVRRLFLREGRPVGFVLIGDVTNAGIYTNIIRNNTVLANITKDNVKNMPNLSVYDAKNRRKILESVV